MKSALLKDLYYIWNIFLPCRRKKKKVKAKTANPVYIDLMEAKYMEERRLEKLKKLKERQALMEQRLK